MPDDLDADAFYEAHEAYPGLDPEALRGAIDTYLNRMHLHITHIHNDTPLTPAEVLDAFRPRTIEF